MRTPAWTKRCYFRMGTSSLTPTSIKALKGPESRSVFQKATKVAQSADRPYGCGAAKKSPAQHAYSDTDLVARAIEDNPWAKEQLVRRYQEKAYALAYHMCDQNAEVAEEMTQEAFLKVFRNLSKFQGRSSFYTWLYRIVVNTCLDRRRRRQRRSKFRGFLKTHRADGEPDDRTLEDQPDPGFASDPFTNLKGKQITRDLKRALENLAQQQRTVFQLKVFNELSIAEIAKIMQLSEGTVKSHLFRATRALRESLKDWANA